MTRAYLALIAVAVAVVGLLSSVFVVNEKQKALVLQFGQIRQVIEEPGLNFKIPLIQEVVYYEDRILGLDTETIEVTPSDDRRLVVDAFARYRIADLVRFRQAVGVGGERAAEDRLAAILNAKIREVLGAQSVTSDTILSSNRRDLMMRIQTLAQAEAANLGLQVVDVRLKQTNLPVQNLDATFARMRAEREREAADEIARGNEAAQRVQALADRTVIETVSEAEREAQVTRGEADAEANRIFAEAYGANPEFFDFYRSLQAYERALGGQNSAMVLTPGSSFFDYLFSADGPSGSAPEVTGQMIEDAASALATATAADQEATAAEAARATATDPAAAATGDEGAAADDAPAAP
ncbi:MAG: protease modulator HflC [Rubellimicrobium sp.]|nr:protease modulator HflC [Rubellimicrobium sp.]